MTSYTFKNLEEVIRISTMASGNPTNLQEGFSYMASISKGCETNSLLYINGLRCVMGHLQECTTTEMSDLIEEKYTYAHEDDIKEAEFASKIWINSGFKLGEECLDSMRAKGCEVEPLSDVTAINNWYNWKTKGMIDKVLDTLPNDVVIVMTDAFFFDGKWEKKFKPHQTVEEGGKITKSAKKLWYFGDKLASSMKAKGRKYPYISHEIASMIKIPYKGSSGLSALVILPEKGIDIENIFGVISTTPDFFFGWKNKLMDIIMPTIDIDVNNDLKDLLVSQNLGDLFTGENNVFEPLTPHNPGTKISSMSQRCKLKVNTLGTKVAAATTMIAVNESCKAKRKVDIVFDVDRPFIFGIVDYVGDPLFLSVIRNPQ